MIVRQQCLCGAVYARRLGAFLSEPSGQPNSEGLPMWRSARSVRSGSPSVSSPRSELPQDDQLRTALTMASQGRTRAEIAAHLRRDKSTIEQWLGVEQERQIAEF